MQQIEIFKTNNKDIMKTKNQINDWLEREKIDVYSISTAQGVQYKSNSYSAADEVEIFLIVLYEK